MLNNGNSPVNLIFKYENKIQMKNMTKLIPNRKNNCLKIFDKYIFRDQGLEIYTESFGSLLILIDEIVKSQKKVKNLN